MRCPHGPGPMTRARLQEALRCAVLLAGEFGARCSDGSLMYMSWLKLEAARVTKPRRTVRRRGAPGTAMPCRSRRHRRHL